VKLLPVLERRFAPLSLFLIVNVLVFLVFVATPTSYFVTELRIPKGDAWSSFLILIICIVLFAVGALFALVVPTKTSSFKMNPKRLSWFAALFFLLSFLGFVMTVLGSGVGFSSFVVGQFNAVKDRFYASYNLFTPFRIFFLSGWVIVFYLIRERFRVSWFVIGLGLIDLGLTFVLNSSRLSILLLIGSSIPLLWGKSRINFRLVLMIFSSFVLLIVVFAFGAFLRDSGTAAGQFSSLLRNFSGYFATPYSYLAFVPQMCSPQLAPQQLFFFPLMQLLPESWTQPWMVNNYSVCRLEAFYNESFTVLSLPGELFVVSGSWLLVGAFFVCFGFVTNGFFRLFLAKNRFGLLVYPLLAATLFDSYRLPLAITNFVFGNLLALFVVAYLCGPKPFAKVQSQ
jgi:hypothetical protein